MFSGEPDGHALLRRPEPRRGVAVRWQADTLKV